MAEFELTYDLNGGDGGPITAAQVEEGTEAPLPDGTGLTKGGFTFGGWSETVGGEAVGTGYLMPGAPTTLYAVWAEVSGGGEGGEPLTYKEFVAECDRIIGVCYDLRTAVDYDKYYDAFNVGKITAQEKIEGVKKGEPVKITYEGYGY